MTTRTRTPTDDLTAFVDAAVSSSTDECIVWPYTTTGSGGGYPRISDRGRYRYVSNVVLDRTVGPKPSAAHEAAHAPEICHNRKCINPRHLRWATRAENQADRVTDETLLVGECHPLAVLTEETVRMIRTDPRPSRILALELGVSRDTVGKVRRGETWRHVC